MGVVVYFTTVVLLWYRGNTFGKSPVRSGKGKKKKTGQTKKEKKADKNSVYLVKSLFNLII